MRAKVWGVHLLIAALVLLSSRHFLYPGDVLWTEQGLVFAWQMKLKGKRCLVRYSRDGKEWELPDISFLTKRQLSRLSDPLIVFEYARLVLCPKWNAVYAKADCQALQREVSPLVRSDVDLCQARYSLFASNGWIIPEPGLLMARDEDLINGPYLKGNPQAASPPPGSLPDESVREEEPL